MVLQNETEIRSLREKLLEGWYLLENEDDSISPCNMLTMTACHNNTKDGKHSSNNNNDKNTDDNDNNNKTTHNNSTDDDNDDDQSEYEYVPLD
jgi:hypothetical protein